MNMPLHRISVIPARDVTFSRVSKSKAKGKEQTGSSASISVPRSFSQTSVTPTSQDICSSSAVYSECCHHSPVQSAVVLKNPVCQNSLTQGSTVTIICQNTVQASKKDLHEHDCVHGLKSKNGKTTQALKFSKSLSDMDQKAQSTSQSFSYVERTCSEGKLTQTQEQCLRLNTFYHKEKKPFNLRPFTFNNSKLSYFQSLSTNYLSTSGASAIHSAVHVPLLEDKCDSELSRSKKLLHCLFSFSHSSSVSSHELDNYSSCLQPKKSPSVIVESTGFCSDDMGDDDVFEDSSSVRLKIAELRAPLCSVEKDSDLDSPSPLSEKISPLSPVSISGDACRLVNGNHFPLIPPSFVANAMSLVFPFLLACFNMCSSKSELLSHLTDTVLSIQSELLFENLYQFFPLFNG